MMNRSATKVIGIAFSCMTAVSVARTGHNSMEWSEAVGRTGENRVVLPVNQVITPAGKQVELHGARPQVLVLSPDGQLLVTSGKTRDLIAIDPDSGAVLQEVALPDDARLASSPGTVSAHILKPNKDEQVSYTGLVFSPDGSRIYLSNVKGSIKVFTVAADHHIRGLGSISLPNADAPRREEEIPAGLAVSRDGKRLYVVGSLSNQLFEYELPTGRLLRDLRRWSGSL